eukprot:2039505-Pleurochrysis_carterae.AAC.1
MTGYEIESAIEIGSEIGSEIAIAIASGRRETSTNERAAIATRTAIATRVGEETVMTAVETIEIEAESESEITIGASATTIDARAEFIAACPRFDALSAQRASWKCICSADAFLYVRSNRREFG